MDGVCLGVVIGSVVLASFPYNVELFLCFPAFEPVHSLVISFSTLGCHRVVDEAFGRGVVCDDRCLGLWVSHLSECSSECDGIFAIVIKGSYFGLSCRAHYVFDDFREGEDSAVVEVFVVIVCQVEVPPSSAL